MPTDQADRESLIQAVQDAIWEMYDPTPTEGVNWRGMAQAAIEAYESNREPDYFINPDDWEITYPAELLGEFEEHEIAQEINAPIRVGTLVNGPARWTVRLALTRDENGEPDKTEIRWFRTEAEAREAIGLKEGEDENPL